MFIADNKDQTINSLAMTGLSFDKCPKTLRMTFTYWNRQSGRICGATSITPFDLGPETTKKFLEFVRSAEEDFGQLILGNGQFSDVVQPLSDVVQPLKGTPWSSPSDRNIGG